MAQEIRYLQVIDVRCHEDAEKWDEREAIRRYLDVHLKAEDAAEYANFRRRNKNRVGLVCAGTAAESTHDKR